MLAEALGTLQCRCAGLCREFLEDEAQRHEPQCCARERSWIQSKMCFRNHCVECLAALDAKAEQERLQRARPQVACQPRATPRTTPRAP